MASDTLQKEIDQKVKRLKAERRKSKKSKDDQKGQHGHEETDRKRSVKSKHKLRRDIETEGSGSGSRNDAIKEQSLLSLEQHHIDRDEEEIMTKERARMERRQMRKGSSEPSNVVYCVESEAVKAPLLIDDDLNTKFERLLKKKSRSKKDGTRRKSDDAKYMENMKCEENHVEKVNYNSNGLSRSATERNLIEMYLAQHQAMVSETFSYNEEENLDANIGDDSVGREKLIHSWHQKSSVKKALELANRTPEMDWLSSFYHCDPRWQILKFFNDVAREGGNAPMDENLASSPLADLFSKATVFTVWRPTSLEAIKNMMLGIATGKGLDIKGKSAKRGNISSYVPFIQVYEDSQKEHVWTYIKEGKTIRVFYQSESARDEAYEMFCDMKDYMAFASEDAFRVLSDEFAGPAEQELAMKHLMYDDSHMNLEFVDTYVDSSHPVFGLDVSERLFWESYVMMQDYSRPEGTEWDTGRKSELAYMDMNLKSLRTIPAPGEPRAVVYQMSKDSPMEPRMLLMAYEEHGRVKPVVSDFDCFLLGSRGVKYKNPITNDQVELLRWSVANIGELLDVRSATSAKKESWMDAWFKVLKSAALKGYYPKTPKYGNGDPKSYEIMEVAVSRLNETGCVRHGAECFNWFFPQEIDDEFLVISDTLPGNVKWKTVNVHELQDILITKVEEGFTFPINPKWVLCDPGWKNVYEALLASDKANVQDSINCWLPPGTRLREEIDLILARHPLGFEATHETSKGKESMAEILEDFERYLKIQRAWRKLRLLLFWIRFVNEKRKETREGWAKIPVGAVVGSHR